MNSHEAVDAESRWTRDDSTKTRPSCTTTRTRYNGPLRAMVCSRDGDEATNQAVAAVMARPAHIHPYAARKKAVTRSPAAALAGNAPPCVMSKSGMISLLDQR